MVCSRSFRRVHHHFPVFFEAITIVIRAGEMAPGFGLFHNSNFVAFDKEMYVSIDLQHLQEMADRGLPA